MDSFAKSRKMLIYSLISWEQKSLLETPSGTTFSFKLTFVLVRELTALFFHFS